MPQKEKNVFEKISHNLFRSQSEAELVLTKDEKEIKDRYMLYVTKMLEDPLISDSSMVTYIMEIAGIQKSQAYKDLSNVRSIVGNIKNANKEWYRFMVVEGLKKSYQRAVEAENVIAEIMALDKLGKYTKLDKDEEEPMPWDQLIPPDFELSDDVRVLDEKLFDPKIDERREKMRSKYNRAIDTDFENV